MGSLSELIVAAQHGDLEAFGRLVERFQAAHAPLTPGGLALLKRQPGTGLIVPAGELAHNLHTRHHGHTLMALLDAPGTVSRPLPRPPAARTTPSRSRR